MNTYNVAIVPDDPIQCMTDIAHVYVTKQQKAK